MTSPPPTPAAPTPGSSPSIPTDVLPPAAPPRPDPPAPPPTPAVRGGPASSSQVPAVLLAVLLVALTVTVGSPALDAPWILGDEHAFIVNNSDVTGADRSEPLVQRWLTIFLHTHEDLYQPIPILTYAIEWWLWGEARVFFMRQTDVWLHALAGLLLWRVLEKLIHLLRPGADVRVARLVTYCAALLWTLHPTLASAFAADMGRTHVLSGVFLLASLGLYLDWLRAGTPPAAPVAALTLLLAALLCKPVAMWFVVVFALEACVRGAPAALRSPGVIGATLLCALFAALTLATSQQAGVLEDVQLALFGDPLSRSLLALWIYAQHIVWPFDLATWYPPDIRTGWTYGPVWCGAAAAVGCMAGAAWLLRKPSTRAAGLGLLWFLAALLPLVGLVGARVAAAQDRYLYVPLMGIMLTLAALLSAGPTAAFGARLALALVPALVALFCVPLSRALVFDARGTLRRAERTLRLDRDDPRRIEFLAMAYLFEATHPTDAQRSADRAASTAPSQSAESRPGPATADSRPSPASAAVAAAGGTASAPGSTSAEDARRLMTLGLAAIDAAMQAADAHPQYFRDAADRAAFYRRMSFQMSALGLRDRALAQAERAASFEPDSTRTLTRLAHCYRAVERWDDAQRCYVRLFTEAPPQEPHRLALRRTEFGDLLLEIYDRPDLALEQYRAAVETGRAPLRAKVGRARCEVLVGQGIDGLRQAQRVLIDDPANVEAAKVIALYNYRSELWEEAYTTYGVILRAVPADYEALRGFHESCVRVGAWQDAAEAWYRAVQLRPDNLAYHSFFIWAAMCAQAPDARRWAEDLLQSSPDDRFACAALALDCLRQGADDDALAWAVRAARGAAFANAFALQRAESALMHLAEQEKLPRSPVLRVRAALLRGAGDEARAAALEAELSSQPTTQAVAEIGPTTSDSVEP